MKLYSSAPGASMTMADHGELNAALRELIMDDSIDIVVESGTFLGTGSTRFVAEAFRGVAVPKRFVTIEINFSNWCQARRNLIPYPFIDCHWGCAVSFREAEDFMRNDDALNRHWAYPDVYIDDIENPLAFYTQELRGQIPFTATALSAADMQTYLWEGENLLRRMLTTHQDHNPLVVLDSAGGIGFLEFNTVLDVMKGRAFNILLDDIHHLKHFRSLQAIRSMPEFEIVNEGPSWALAMHHHS